MSDAVLHVAELRKSVGPPERVLFDGASLDVKPGEIVAVCGKSGSGKSSLLNVVGGMDRDFSGTVEVCGQNIATLDDDARADLRLHRVGMVFQAFHLVEHLTLARNVMLPARFASSEEQRMASTRSIELLSRVGLADRAHQTPRALSGGERQRVAIARALLMKPKLLLADEPTGNLDRSTAEEVLKAFTDLAHESESAVLLVTHDEKVASVAHRTLWLKEGKLSMINMPPRVNGHHGEAKS